MALIYVGLTCPYCCQADSYQVSNDLRGTAVPKTCKKCSKTFKIKYDMQKNIIGTEK